MTARGNQGHVPDAPALKKHNPAEHEGRRRRAGGATGRRKRDSYCQSLLTFLTRPSLTRRIASQLDRLTAAARRSGGAQRYLKPQGGRGGVWEARRRLAACAHIDS